MRKKKTTACLLSAMLIMAFTNYSSGDDADCIVLSDGSARLETPGATAILGQALIGRSTNGTLVMHAGAIHCSAESDVQCLLGDVDNNGLINGMDIDDYIQVVTTEMGTPQELCAAAIDIDAFVALLLGN